MVGHQAICGTHEPVTVAGMQKEFSQHAMVCVVEPADRAILEGHRPVNS